MDIKTTFSRLWGLGLAMPLCLMSNVCVFAQGKEEPPSLPVVAASTDLQQVLPVIARLFEEAGGGKTALRFDAPGNIYRDIRDGAAVELFLAGGDTWPQKLKEEGKTFKDPQAYALDSLALYTPRRSALNADAFLGDVRGALREGRLTRFVIADPDNSSYGRLAKEALRRKLVWDDIQSKLIIVNDVAQMVPPSVNQNAEGALIAYVQAKNLVRDNGGRAVLLSDAICSPITQEMVLLKGAGQTAQLFFDFMRRREVKKLLLDYGYKLPGGETAAALGYY